MTQSIVLFLTMGLTLVTTVSAQENDWNAVAQKKGGSVFVSLLSTHGKGHGRLRLCNVVDVRPDGFSCGLIVWNHQRMADVDRGRVYEIRSARMQPASLARHTLVGGAIAGTLCLVPVLAYGGGAAAASKFSLFCSVWGVGIGSLHAVGKINVKPGEVVYRFVQKP